MRYILSRHFILMAMSSMHAMNALQRPHQQFFSLPWKVVVGASSDRSKFGNKVLRCYQSHGHNVVPINKRQSVIEGILFLIYIRIHSNTPIIRTSLYWFTEYSEWTNISGIVSTSTFFRWYWNIHNHSTRRNGDDTKRRILTRGTELLSSAWHLRWGSW